MAPEKNSEEKYMQLQMLQQHAEQISEHIQKLQTQLQEITSSVEALRGLQSTKVNTEILAPVANGIFLKAALQDNQNLVVNVGAEVTVEKTIPEVITLLEEQQGKITENIAEAEAVFQQLQEQGQKMYQDIGASE
jgi:prefoldin alpha subunit